MPARVTSAIFVSSIIRRVNVSGGFAAVVQRGADDAGAIFICVPQGGEGTTLYAQAPQSVVAGREGTASGGRLFERVGESLSEEELSARFSKEARLDPDFWILEIELFGQEAGDFFDIA